MLSDSGQFPPIKIGFVGGGRRMQTVYLPVCKKLAASVQVVGFTRRKAELGKQTAATTGVPFFASVTELVAQGKPDILIICVPPSATLEAARAVMRTGKPFLVETPVGADAAAAKRFLKALRGYKEVVGVLEQKPFLPLEQLKRLVLDTDVLGKIILVENDFRSYDYHASAQLRRYLPNNDTPISASATARVSQIPGQGKETWCAGFVSFASGAILVHNMTSAYKSLNYRVVCSLRAYGESGSLVDNTLSFVDKNKNVHACAVEEIRGDNGCLQSLIMELPGKASVVWNNPFPSLLDEEVAIATHFLAMARAVRGHAKPLYSVENAVTDVMVMEALRASGDRGSKLVSIEAVPARWLGVFHLRWWINTLRKLFFSI